MSQNLCSNEGMISKIDKFDNVMNSSLTQVNMDIYHQSTGGSLIDGDLLENLHLPIIQLSKQALSIKHIK